MDTIRPELDFKCFNKICLDKNGVLQCDYMNWDWHGILQVPVIALFTKYDQFRRNIQMNLADKPDKQHNHPLSEMEIDAEVESTFQREYFAHLRGNLSLKFIRLEREGFLFFTFY